MQINKIRSNDNGIASVSILVSVPRPLGAGRGGARRGQAGIDQQSHLHYLFQFHPVTMTLEACQTVNGTYFPTLRRRLRFVQKIPRKPRRPTPSHPTPGSTVRAFNSRTIPIIPLRNRKRCWDIPTSGLNTTYPFPFTARPLNTTHLSRYGQGTSSFPSSRPCY